MQSIDKGNASPSPDLSQARSRFGRLIGSVYRQWRRQVDLSFKDMELTDATRMPLLILYVDDAPMRQKDLAEALYLDTSSLVRVLDQLRRKKLVDWTSHPADRRTKLIGLTPQGQHVAALILEKSLQIEQEILSGLTPEELETTRRALSKISERFNTLASECN